MSVSSTASGLTTSSSIGGPNCTSAVERSATLSGKVSPTGTIARRVAPAARAPSAIRAAPVLIGSMRGRSCVVPSGKMATTSRSTSAWWHSWNALSVPDGAAAVDLPVDEHHPARRSSQPATGTRWSAALATNRGVRRIALVMSTGSTNPLKWLATSSTGRSVGYRSLPATSTRWNSSAAANRATQAIRRRTRPAPWRQSRGPLARLGAVTRPYARGMPTWKDVVRIGPTGHGP